jgi:hypothetical protein
MPTFNAPAQQGVTACSEAQGLPLLEWPWDVGRRVPEPCFLVALVLLLLALALPLLKALLLAIHSFL